MIAILTVTFVYISCQPHFDHELDYVIRKPIRHRIQRYTVHTEILPTFHTRVKYISHVTSPTEMNGAQMPRNARNHARNSRPVENFYISQPGQNWLQAEFVIFM